jgi:hypothetical protein
MQRLKYLSVLLAVLLVVTSASAQEKAGDITALNGVVFLSTPATGNGTFQITGSFTGTIGFEASLDGSNFTALNAFPTNSTTAATSATGTGIWTYSGAYKVVRARATAWTSGTATIRIIATWARAGGGVAAAGGGSGTVSSGTTNVHAKYTGATTVGDSCIADDGSITTITCATVNHEGSGSSVYAFKDGSGNVIQLVTAEGTNYCPTAPAGGSDTYACNVTVNSVALQAYATGICYQFKADVANTGAATINFNALGAKTIKKVGGGITTDLADNDIRVGQMVKVCYDGTNMQMISQLGNTASGGSISTGRVHVTKSANQSINNTTDTAITWDTEAYDDGGLHDNVTNNTRLTAVTAGVYVIACTLNYPGAAGAQAAAGAWIRANGSTVVARNQVAIPTGSQNGVANAAAVYKLALNEYVECMGYQSSGGAVNVQSSISSFNMARVQD